MEFSKICSSMKEFGTDLMIRLTPSDVKFIVSGDEADGSLCLTEANNVHLQINVEIEQNFAIKHLVTFCKAAPLSDVVELELGEGFPMRVSFIFTNSDFIRYYLAPKIDE